MTAQGDTQPDTSLFVCGYSSCRSAYIVWQKEGKDLPNDVTKRGEAWRELSSEEKQVEIFLLGLVIYLYDLLVLSLTMCNLLDVP